MHDAGVEQKPTLDTTNEPWVKSVRKAQLFKRARSQFVLTGQHTERSPLFGIELRRQYIKAFAHLAGTMTVAKLVGGNCTA